MAVSAPEHPNVLYLMADDMRPQLGAYGHLSMHTPNLDKLAAGGLIFDTAYTQFAYCAPSRNSFMTGRRPERTRCLNFKSNFRQNHGDAWVSMPQHFKNNGYFTSAAGKLYHDGMDDPASWSYPSNQTAWIQCQEGDFSPADAHGNYCGITNASKKQFTDEDLALAEGLKRLEAAHASGKPWWVGIGVHRPHWSSRLPDGWWGSQVYPGIVAPPKHPLAPIGAPYMSGNWLEGDYADPAHGCPNCSVPASRSVEYRRWYYAATSYADHMLGRALDKLEALGVHEETITVFHADHGYQLGELNEWSKKTDTELATRVPLMIRVPWKARAIGVRSSVRVELLDMFKTLAELAGISAGVQPDVQGVSLAPLFDDPEGVGAVSAALQVKPAFSQIGSCACKTYSRNNWTGLECGAARCLSTPVAQFDFMGYTMRTADGWRFTAWVPMNANTSRVDWSRQVYHELYDLRGASAANNSFDFDGMSLNVASDQVALVEQLHEQLQEAVESWY